ncbi:Cerato-platanin [Dactylonectria macrodidyma]|uniref:Cerato-platanin n=1 Tax=Dactylonectria macrodidyma TaxID=307937 RepID=A0A9P9J9Z1_9HYPO|nr:Cerato-platanin [Dactylonectria macrodidyma]
MRYFSLFSMPALLAPALAVSVTFNPKYDDIKRPLTEVACWNNETGLIPGYNWENQGNVPPRIIAMDTITGPTSTACVTCWILEYGDRARPFLAIDGAESGFVLSLEGMNSLTNGKAKKLGHIEANATQVDMLNCGIYDPPSEEL